MPRIEFWKPEGELTPQVLSDVLGLVSSEVSPVLIQDWSLHERMMAWDWAWREHLRASDNSTVRRRQKPWLVITAEAQTRQLAGKSASGVVLTCTKYRADERKCGDQASYLLLIRDPTRRDGGWEARPRCPDHPPEDDLKLIARVMPTAQTRVVPV
jgi:hypothetical protein